jgi:hypothetical protein
MPRGLAAAAARDAKAPAPPVAPRHDAVRDHWLAGLGEHQARVCAWLEVSRDPATRGLPSTRQEGMRLASRAHALAAEGLLARLAGGLPGPRPAPTPGLPPPIAGGGDDAQVARLIEHAAANQVRALGWVRRARDPSAPMVPPLQRREMLLRAIEHIATSRRLLHRAQTLAADGTLDEVLARHLAQLEDASASVERLVHDLDEAQQA